jgi:hypothetical protein
MTQPIKHQPALRATQQTAHRHSQHISNYQPTNKTPVNWPTEQPKDEPTKILTNQINASHSLKKATTNRPAAGDVIQLGSIFNTTLAVQVRRLATHSFRP